MPQKPWTLTWKTYDAYLSRQLVQANPMFSCKFPFLIFFFKFRVCKSIFKADMEQQISLKAIMYPGISIKKLPNDMPVDSLEVQLETENNDQKKIFVRFCAVIEEGNLSNFEWWTATI